MAIQNFIARRGTPIEMHSDCGTNFQGASKELQQTWKNVDEKKLMKEFTSTETTWKFIPPASPHMGGSWERMVQTVKKNLNRIQPGRSINDEILKNMLVEIENTVNSRPLTHVPIDDESAPALTPNHFLLGSSNGTKPAVSFTDTDTALLRSWHTSHVVANLFWKRWVQDYLPTLTRRTKWFAKVKPIEVGDIVIVVDPRLPRNCWPKGRVISTTCSRDGQVRRATVQTTSGIYERPAVKLAVLDVRRVSQ